MGICEGFARFIFVAFNVIFVLFGIGVLGAGIWVKADPQLLNVQKLIELDASDKFLSTAGWILIIFGVLVLAIGVFGCVGGIKKNKCFLGIYIGLVTIIFIGELSGGILAAVFKGKISDELDDALTGTLKTYKPKNANDIVTKTWDEVQKLFSCCGIQNYADYAKNNVTFSGTQLVPNSCCNPATNDTICQTEAAQTPGKKGATYTSLYNQGCYPKFNDLLSSHLTLIIGLAIAIAMFPLFGICLACVTCKDGSVEHMA
ncbi:23 kDa integral membrane protein-like [Mizuhopecten yessoensis]|uniref:Tetraspanin n=1 Tax=Mizuhopecten yessoensis TaxID=6573 RepID=A0A210QPT9_MIZYE|nr:23 kDa integral membrane protein-like [Mizuhopecten yessoensis]OWF50739.1 Tetraspanin-5 [Mizuhopecten yessoensis]